MKLLRKIRAFWVRRQMEARLQKLGLGRAALLIGMTVKAPRWPMKPRTTAAGIAFVTAVMLMVAPMSESRVLGHKVPKRNLQLAIEVATETLEKTLPRIPRARAQEIIKASYEAGRLTPSLGPQGLAAVRWPSIAYGESGMDPKAVNHNANGSVDRGFVQVNSVHLKPPRGSRESEWSRFCRANGFSKSIKSLENIRINMLFGAHIQEMHAKNGGTWSYKWASPNQPSQRAFYRKMVTGVRIGLRRAGIDYKTLQNIPTVLASR